MSIYILSTGTKRFLTLTSDLGQLLNGAKKNHAKTHAKHMQKHVQHFFLRQTVISLLSLNLCDVKFCMKL